APAAVAPIASIVVISDVPMLSIGVTHERVAAPLRCTVQAPHSAMPQPNLVPVMPSTSRSTHSNGVSPSTSTLCAVPLTLMLKAMAFSFLQQRSSQSNPANVSRSNLAQSDRDGGQGNRKRPGPVPHYRYRYRSDHAADDESEQELQRSLQAVGVHRQQGVAVRQQVHH